MCGIERNQMNLWLWQTRKLSLQKNELYYSAHMLFSVSRFRVKFDRVRVDQSDGQI